MLALAARVESSAGRIDMADSLLQLIDAEISRLQEVRSLLAKASNNGTTVAVPGEKRKYTKHKKHSLSPEGRARIAAAVKARWAKQKKAAKG